jgi:hypothetical protein
VAITATATTLNAVETATITFTLSEPAGDFTATDVLVTLGTLTGFAQQSALVYTATFTPDAGVAGVAGTASITVPPASFTDTAGNANVGGPSLQIAVNTIAPTIAIATSATTLTAGQTATITFTLSEPADDFAAADVLVGLGTLSGFAQQSETVYTATFTPDVGAAGATAITVVSRQFTNAAGNANVGNQSQPIQIDTRLPTVTIASGASTLAAGEQTTITFTLSEPSPNFTAAAVDVLYGSLSGFAPVAGVTGLVYTATFTADPTLTFYVIGRVEVPAGRFTDQAGNPNVAASGPITITVTYGVPAPTVAIGTTATALKAFTLSGMWTP